ncbi:ATP-binding protein [Pseudaquabacterium pictum]|nr:ATP-binding protein [Rubrivivax pictus]
MNESSTTANALPRTEPETDSLAHIVLRGLALAVLCAALQALLPAYTLGTAMLVPLSVVLGVAAAAAIARGRWTVPAALAGVLVADLAVRGIAWQPALLATAVLGLQATLVGWLMRHAADPDLLLLDTWPRLRRLVLVAAPAAAALGVLGGALGTWVQETVTAAQLRPQLAGAVGRFIADAAGIIVTAPVLLCWLARPAAPWRPRRRLVALPLVLMVAVLLPGLHQVASRDEQRLQVYFDREANLRRVRVQQLLATPMDAVLTLRGVLTVAGGQDTALFNQLSNGWMGRIAGLRATGWLERGSADGELLLPHAVQQTGEATALPALRPGANGQLQPDAGLAAAVERALAGPGQPVLHPLVAAAPAAAQLLVLQGVAPAAAGSAATRLVFARVDAHALLAPVLPDDDDPNLRVCLLEGNRDAGKGSRQRLAGPRGCEADVPARALRAAAYALTVGEQRLDLLVTEPPTADNRLFTAVWLLALPAVAGMAMLGALLLALSGRLRRIEDRVQERTAALRAEVDERRQAEARLAVSEQRFRAIFDGVNIGVTVVDPAGRITEVNPAFCQMMGCPPDALLQRPLADFRLPDVAEDDGTAAAMGGGQARRQRFLTPDGRVLQVAASLRTLHDASGAPVATVGALQDLTQVLRLREAERERDQAEVASRTKSDFLARLSHELRAPLNAILGFAQMLGNDDMAGGEGLQPQQRHGLAQIRQAGWHLLDMINDVLDLSRMEAGGLRLTLEPVSLPDVAQEAMAMVEPAAQQAQVQVELSLSPQAEWVQADPVRLRQVLVNLLGNAVKYNRRGGQVVLRTRPGAVGEVSIEVEDTGIGMDADQLGALFTPFNRLGREQNGVPGQPGSQGTGIGLVICRKLTELMAGTLEVSSQAGQGSVFSLALPRPAGEPQRTVVNAGALRLPQVSIGKVLYIEDSTADTTAMQALLAQRPGVTLVCAGTATEGLALAADADLVLLDLDLPDHPGIEVLRALRADSRWKTLQVIVVSAESRPQRIDECFDAGASQFLTKPLDAQQVLRAVDEALRH